MSGTLRVDPERTRRDRREFLGLPYRLYRGHPFWVPPLRMAERQTFDRKKNPFFRHAEVQHFLARRGRRVVGRMAAIHNPLHNETYGDKVGFFGFFDAEPDAEAVRALVETARRWVSERGLDRLRGPVNYSTNDSCAVLVDGFDDAPTILMPYNRPDYDELLKGAGLEQEKDLLAWWIDSEVATSERFGRIVERRLSRSNIQIRKIALDDVQGEIRRLRDVYNRCWADNWGFVPATVEEFEHAAAQMKTLVHPDLSAVAELDGQPVGLSLILRDINELLRGTNGYLFPKALFRLLFRMNRVSRVRIIALGVVPEARGRGINEAFFLRAVNRGQAERDTIRGGEAGWILEENEKMVSPIKTSGGVATKRYRLYVMDA